MQLDWSQIVTQIIGFLLLVWLLKKFAWKPILQLLETRRNKIIAEFERIDRTKQEVERLKQEYEQQLKTIDVQARQKILEAVQEGQKIALEIQEQARDDARQLIEKAKQNIDLEIAKAKVELRNEIVNMTLQATEKMILEKLDDQKHRELITQYIGSLENIKGTTKTQN
ncbi:MAG: F0F1 ATP synthase subunit B [bacterium]|nr:F0F1 ATP synthase subunit B [bacterium]